MLTEDETIKSVIALYLKKIENMVQSDRDRANDYPELHHPRLKEYAKVHDKETAIRIGGEIWGHLRILADGDEVLMKTLAAKYYQEARVLFITKHPEIELIDIMFYET